MQLLYERVKRMLIGEDFDEKQIKEYIETVSDRLCIRLNCEELPSSFNTICADAVVKMYRRFCYEGISSESDGGISTSFVDDILSEYDEEISNYRRRTGAVRFL